MKIISRGKNPEDKPIRFECRKCKTVFEAEQSKEARYVNDMRDGDFWSCPCPVCATECTRSVR